MSAFWTFATCLTVAYIIYYSVIVWRDLSKPKEQVYSSEETFEMADTVPKPTRIVGEASLGRLLHVLFPGGVGCINSRVSRTGFFVIQVAETSSQQVLST